MSSAREFIIYITEHYYCKTKLNVNENHEQVLADFIQNAHTLLLQGIVEGDSLLFFTKICSNKNKSVVFYKTYPQNLLQEDSIKSINIITLSNSAAESLYHILQQVSPLLSLEDNLYSNKLQKNLSELEINLRILTYGKNDQTMHFIMSIEDEVNYWNLRAQKKDSPKKERESASTICEFFEDISEELRSIQSSSISEIREITENIGGLLDDVWRFTTLLYPEDRMMHIFDIISHTICTTIQKSCTNLELWKIQSTSKENEILIHLSESLKVIQTWISACQSLTETYWPNYALHTWNGKAYVPQFCFNFQTRLKEINQIRSTYSQLNKLLTNSEKSELKTHLFFEPFESINIWLCNGPNQAWESAVATFAAALRPAESKIAEKLKPRLHNTSTKQMLYEFMRYKALIERPLVKQALNSELDIFVSSLFTMLKTIQSQLDSDETDVKMYQPPEMSPIVQKVQWAKQMETKVKDIQTCVENYLNEFENSIELSKLSVRLLKDLKDMYMQLHEEWCRDLQAQVKNGSLQLALDKPVVEFCSSNRLMVVNFNPRLVWAEQEARALAACGLPLPAAASALDALSAALVHARALQQVASFHNTLGERMIPSTRPMMLQAALDLSALVQDQKSVYWNDVEQLANYTDKLKKVVLKLESQNTYLTSQHIAIRNIVEKLIDTELLSQQSEWKKSIKDIRDIIDKVESNGYKNTELWRSHWDWQLYKVLECQYIKTLLSLHKHFPHVRVDLVIRGHKVCVQPAMEELRVQHYHQLRRLVALPQHFVGLSDERQLQRPIFANIVDKHSWLGNRAACQVEAALQALAARCRQWERRGALACSPRLAELCGHLHQPHHFDLNFKACKAAGQAVAKMDFEDEKIEWISVGTATLRREFEAQARNLWTILMSSLQTSCRKDVETIDTFVAGAKLALENKDLPKNTKELAEISAKQQALQSNLPEMEQLVEALKRKGHMLRTWGGDASVDDTIKEWLKMRELIQSQQQMFEQQAEIVKSSLKGEWENLEVSVEAWVSRWQAAAARAADGEGAGGAAAASRCADVFAARDHYHSLRDHRDRLLKECDKFDMKLEPRQIWQDAEKLVNDLVVLWTPLKEYNEEYELIAEQEWIVFQKKLHVLDEFVSKWSGLLEPYTMITLYIQQELEKYTDLTMLLKYLRGNDFTEQHWREVYGLLDMEYKKPDTLLVRDLLNVASNIKKQIKALQKISTSASSEAAIRSALNEMELWYAGAKLAIIYYTDKAKRSTPIVKDFKEILTKVEEYQWVVSSLGTAASSACSAWEARLRAARLLLRAAHHVQRRWLYLEAILSNDDGDLGVKFRKVDQAFRQVSRILEADSRLSALMQSSRLQTTLDSISEQLLVCQSALNQYIDDKRSIFPRLYFLSDDDLLELLGQARAGAEGREAVMQNHLKKLFPGTTGVRLGPGGMSITALCSHNDEILQLDHPVDIDCAVEVWLKNLENEMRTSLKNMALKCIVTNSLQDQDPFSLPTQILCLAQNIRFTEQAEKAIATKELHKLKDNIEKENSYYAAAEVEDGCEQKKRQALILQCAHYAYIVQTLIENNVVSANDWIWQKQLRFYLRNTKEIIAEMGLAQISYSYEYLGVDTGQFVRTDIADECFLILTQSLHLGLVGNPFGPAGTGKTESVKALGGLVGRLVLIFNCDEAMDAECMGRLLSGLALSGAWGCFDEFNRLSADTLAAVAHQLASLLPALLQHRATATAPSFSSSTHAPPIAILNGKQVAVSGWCGVMATLNPAARGYGGRRELPAALQRALRPAAGRAAAPVPLAARLLAAAGVPHAPDLALRLHDVFHLASTLLSNERHYDWGLRALKAAVSSCSAALSALGAQSADHDRALHTVRTVLALNNLSKLTPHDARRFEDILSLVFGDNPEKERIDPMKTALESSVQTLGLASSKLQLQKCSELYEQLQQRMGVAIVGPPGSGKTTIRQILKNALIQQGKTIMEYVISPKAMSRKWLLGHIDLDTRQWTDGVISAIAQEVSNQPPDVWPWVVCDGDVEPEWVEALNSVLDDNRLLTLPAGGRVHLATTNFLFETHTLRHASPATISRLGIVLLGDENNCSKEALNSWIKTMEFDNESTKMTLPLLQEMTEKCLDWLDAHKTDLVMKISNTTMVKQVLTQFTYIAQNVNLNAAYVPEDLTYLAIQRSVTGLLKENSMDSFYEELQIPLRPTPFAEDALSGVNASAGTWVSERLFVSQRLAACERVLQAAAASAPASASACHAHLLLVGADASAKNLLIEHVLKETNSIVITIDCTPILEPVDIIGELKRNNVVRASAGTSGRTNTGGETRVTLVVRSLHRAPVDSWGSCAIQQFLLQIIQQSGFWTAGGGGEMGGEGGEAGGEGATWWQVGGARVIAAARAAPLADSRLALALAPCVLSEPDDDELIELTKSSLKSYVDKYISENEILTLTNDIVSMFKEVTKTFQSQNHYKWNASHLMKWTENIKWYSPTNMVEIITGLSAEADAIFRDRLVTDEEKNQFTTISRKYLKTQTNDKPYFTAKLRSDGVYMEMVDKKEWYQWTQKLINQCLTDDENSFGETGVEVCSELAILCPAIARATSGGVVVCVSGAGTGVSAAATLAAAALPATAYYAEHTQHFNATFKNALCSASEGRTVLMVRVGSDSQAEAGAGPELAAIETVLRARSLRTLPPKLRPNQLPHHQLHDIKQNLGILICIDKNQDNISELFEKYPLLYDESHLVWLENWSTETLREVPRLIINRLMKENLSQSNKDEAEPVPVDGFVNIYGSIDSELMRAPCRYVNFVKTYYRIVSRKRDALLQRQGILSAGVEALRRARSSVQELQRTAAVQQEELGERRAAAAAALDQITATVTATTDKKDEMHALKRSIQIENDNLQIRKKEIEAELASVEPVIAAARAAVGDIRPESLSEVRSLRAPPDVVRDILEGVLRLMGIADTSWHSMKNFLSKRGVKEDIRCLDASQISAEAVSSVQRLLARRGASFEQAAARRASAACAPLAAWVRANLAYADALARVQPLQAQQRHLHKNLQDAEAQLAALSSGLESVESRVAALKEQLGQHTRDAAALELKLATATDTIAAATGLIDRLADEYDAWEQDLEHISKEITELNPRSLLAAAYIVYLPHMTEPQARDYINKWSALIGFDDPTFSVPNFLSTTEKQLKWEAEGLPSDMSAVKNAILIDQILEGQNCGFTTLIVDPDGDAISWLKNTLAGAPCEFVSQHSDKLQTAVQYAVRLGRVLVVMDVEQLHEAWASVVCGWRQMAGGSRGAARARLVLVSRAATHRLPPHVAARLSTVHFAARLDPLTDRLIYYALQQQNPDVTEKSKEIKMTKAVLQKQQHELQENLLRELSTKSDILHDAGVLASLDETRATSATTAAALAAAREHEARAHAASRALGRSARRAARLALAVRRLAARRALLALPLDVALHVYADAVRTRPDPKNINDEEVIKIVTKRIIERVSLALHKKDKYIVILHLLKEVYDEQIPHKLWQIFIGNLVIEDQTVVDEIKKSYSWIPNELVDKVAQIKVTCEELFNKLSLNNEEIWREYLSSGDPAVIARLQLTPFENAVAVSALRPESLYRAIVTVVDHFLGAGATSVDPVLAAVRAGRGARARPLLALGAHVADVLAARAHTLHQVGIEEGRAAWEAAVERTRRGGWLLLLVGASPFTQELQHFIDDFIQRPAEDFSDEFRLWIVTEERDIPPLISNACINVILEAAAGVKHNALCTVSAWAAYRGPPRAVRLHALLALFHALAQERRAYIPQGWSQWYAWGWGEASACAEVARGGGDGGDGGEARLQAARALCLALYEARVPAAADRAVLAAMQRACLHDRAFGHHYSPRGLRVALPSADTLQAYVPAFEALPDIDTPQLLGLPANCGIAWEKKAASDIIAGLKELSTTDKTSEDDTGDGSSLKTLLSLWKKLMAGNPLLKGDYVVENYEITISAGASAARGTDAAESAAARWWGGAAAAEARDAGRAARALHAALARARRRPASALHKVPEEWQMIWAGPEAPVQYVRELSARARAAVERLRIAPARIPADDSRRAEGVIVVGLRLSGAEWRAGALVAVSAQAAPHCAAPPLLLYYVPQAQESTVVGFEGMERAEDATLEVPVYSSEAREELVLSVRAPLARSFPRDEALLNAVALFIAPVELI
ncbi:cytoplasmic dynein 2 heavy chain 1 isoform X2 [Galleria mellonella]|uniref:Cytoplasmic dynein 2 heavy chain 1 isoform X2 n=1 Tax=Galleria mellonella TaxID=7137 RepID=A0ABM3MJS7_GALME|nr:cytoplasmic dynein 2 heavy chain 1 isoform X2 [Galleria mellonella]